MLIFQGPPLKSSGLHNSLQGSSSITSSQLQVARGLPTKLKAGSVSGELMECSRSPDTSARALKRNHWHLAYNGAEMEAEGGAVTSISACRLVDRRNEKVLGQVIWVGSFLWVCYHHFTNGPVNPKDSEYFTQSDLPESLGGIFYLASQITSVRVPDAAADQVILSGIYPKTT